MHSSLETFMKRKDYLLNVHEESYADSKGHIGNE